MFELDLLDGGEGDAFLVRHTGSAGATRFGLIDGGTKGRWSKELKPVLASHGITKSSGTLDWLAISHIDDDHIGGIQNLVAAKLRATAYFFNVPQPDVLRDVVVSSTGALTGGIEPRYKRLLSRMPAQVVTQTVAQGEAVLAAIRQGPMGVAALNPPTNGRLLAGHIVEIDGLVLKVLSPSEVRLDVLFAEWEATIGGPLTQSRKAKDTSVSNLSSLTFLAECEGRSVLFTGDALEEDVLAGLAEFGLPTPLRVDVLKLAHHGSTSASDQALVDAGAGLLELVAADHYVIPADGQNTNPSIETLERVVRACAGRPATIWFPVFRKPSDKSDAKRHYDAALAALDQAIADAGTVAEGITVMRRDDGKVPLTIPLA